MRLYISSDMEGIAGVCAWQQVDARKPDPEYPTYQRYYTEEVKAAIDGARAAGASTILVNDSHGPMRNLLLDELPADVAIISGNRKPFSMAQNGDAGFDAAFFIGYHGGAGDANAVLCHTYTPSVIYDVHVNGTRCSEATLNAALLGYWGVPLALVSGDRTTIDGIQAQMPWVTGVAVKESIGNFAANSMTPGAARRAIAAAAERALRDTESLQLFTFTPPIELEVQLTTAAQAHLVATMPGFERSGSRSVRFVHDSFPVVFKAFIATWRLGATSA